MMDAMDRVGLSIHSSYHWIPPAECCYLVMDNADGHGSDDAIEKYVRMLKEKHNIEKRSSSPFSVYKRTGFRSMGVITIKG